MNRDPWWVTEAPMLAGLALPATILVLILLAAVADAPVFFLVLAIGGIVILVARRWRRRGDR